MRCYSTTELAKGVAKMVPRNTSNHGYRISALGEEKRLSVSYCAKIASMAAFSRACSRGEPPSVKGRINCFSLA